MELEKRLRPHLRSTNGSWRVDETYIKVKGRWVYLYRAVDSRGQTIDFRLSARLDRRQALQAGTLAGMGLLLPDLLRARAESRPAGAGGTFGRAKSVIMLYLHGGHAQQGRFRHTRPGGPGRCPVAMRG